MYMVINAEAREEDESYRSPVDLLFDDLERVDEDHIAVKNWKVFKQAGPKTAKSILVSASTRLAAFNTEEMAHLTSRDDLALGTLGDRKRVIFAVIPDEDTTFNYLVGLLYSQAFRELYHAADNKYGGRLPVPVRVLMDEFANVALPEDFERVLATCRSREISINIVIQNMAQLKKLFKDSWENVTGNCDTLLYLGGNEASTHEYISKMLGKATIDTRTRGVTKGRSGSSSTNYQNAGREHIVAVWRSNGGNEVILSIRNLTLRVGGGLRPYAGHLIISHGDAPMYAVIGNPQPDFGPNASALVIRPVPIGHHGIVFRVIDHISVAVVVAGAGRLRLNGIGKPLRFYPMHSVAGGNDGRVFVDGDPHHVGRINGPIAIAVPRFFQDNYVRVSHLVIGMRTVAVIGGKILISGGLVQCGLAGVCRKRRGWK